MYGGGSQYDGNGGAANTNNQFDGGRFMPPQTTSTPEGGSVITRVRLVGRMLKKKQQVTDVSFVLDDSTGRIEMKRWDNETFDTEEMKLVKLVTNYNDITHHFLHCIYVHLDLARPKRSLSQPQVIANTSTRNQALHTSNQAPTSSASGNTAGKELSDLVMSVFHDPVLGLTVLHLVDLGNLYATIDDDHYKSTMNG
ncbi:hypothetical protein ACQ4PT_035438 [Festuca glaucescens]